MNTVTITIGRGRNDRNQEPMGYAEWSKFRRIVGSFLANREATVFVDDAQSEGEWEGRAEESRTWVATVPKAEDVVTLRTALAWAAREYHQDAIAMTVGETALVA